MANNKSLFITNFCLKGEAIKRTGILLSFIVASVDAKSVAKIPHSVEKKGPEVQKKG